MEQAQFIKEITPYRERLMVYAERLLENRNDAEDTIQEVFLKLWRMRNELGGYISVFALSLTITKRLCINRLKINQRKEKHTNGSVMVDPSLSPDVQFEMKDDVTQVIRMIDQLPQIQQIIIRMKHIDGLETDEIAAITGSTPEAIRMNLSRARKKIKEQFLKNNR